MFKLIRLILVAALFSVPVVGKAKDSFSTDLLIVGGTESGCAAAVQAARMGVKSITLVNDIEWLGGQFSAESLVAIDENRPPSGYGHGVPFPRSGLFKETIDRIESINKKKYGQPRPGNTQVITTCLPSDAERAFRELLEPYVEKGQVRLVSHFYPVAAKVDPKTSRLTEVTFRSTEEVRSLTIKADVTIDASDWGDVMRLAGVEYEFGPDLKSTYGEPLAPESREGYPFTDMNPVTYCMLIEETDEYKVIPKPPGYDQRNYEGNPYPKDPMRLYRARRVVDHYGFPEINHPDVILLCYAPCDYPLDVLPQQVVEALEANETGSSKKNIVEMSREQRQIIFEDAKNHSLGYLYYLQTVVHDQMKDKTHSFRRFKLSDDFGTADKMPFKPYIRESLRIKAEHMLKQQETTGFGNNSLNYAQMMFHDSIASYQFEYDFHPTGRKFLEAGNPAGPWHNYFRKGRTWGPPYSGLSVFPMRSLIPRNVGGLLAAQKNLGYTSIVSSAVRLHDQSMAIGQGAGAVAAVALKNKSNLAGIPFDFKQLSEVWQGLSTNKGQVPSMLWPFRDLEPAHPAFPAINQLAVRHWLPMKPTEVLFEADQQATENWKEQLVELSLANLEYKTAPETPQGEMTRGEFCQRWWELVKAVPWKELEQSNDHDEDGLANDLDPLPFHPHETSWQDWKPDPHEDGLPQKLEAGNRYLRQFNFAGAGTQAVKGFELDQGLPYTAERGFGWQRDLSKSHRRRGRVAETVRDTFLFTRTHDIWECQLPNGTYEVTVCIGDSGHEQIGQNVMVEDEPVFHKRNTLYGYFAEKTVVVQVNDGQLTVEIGKPDSQTNTCLNWLQIKQQD